MSFLHFFTDFFVVFHYPLLFLDFLCIMVIIHSPYHKRPRSCSEN